MEVHKTGFPSGRLVHKSLSSLIRPYRSAQMAGAVITFPQLGPSISLIPGWYSQHTVCTCEGNGSIRSSSTLLAGGHKRIAPKAFLHVPPSLDIRNFRSDDSIYLILATILHLKEWTRTVSMTFIDRRRVAEPCSGDDQRTKIIVHWVFQCSIKFSQGY